MPARSASRKESHTFAFCEGLLGIGGEASQLRQKKDTPSQNAKVSLLVSLVNALVGMGIPTSYSEASQLRQ